MDCLTKFNSPQLELLHRGKVRDSLRVDDATRMIVVTDRISAFNKKIKTPIPTKGAVLNGIANFWFDKTSQIIDNHIIRQVDDYITLVKEAEPIRVEMVVRAYLTGSMWRGYQEGKRKISDVTVPDGMVKNQKFDSPILTPTTKDDDDTEIDEKGIIEGGLVSADIYEQMKKTALEIFNFASDFLLNKGIILVDTKYEFGLLDGKLIIIDEMHTPDSSRFWSAEDYKANPANAEQIDKEFVRQWMLANKIDGEVPTILNDEIVKETSNRYQEIYNTVTGNQFSLPDLSTKDRIYQNLTRNGVIKKAVIAVLSESDITSSFNKFAEDFDIALIRYNFDVNDNLAREKWLENMNNTVEPVAVIAYDDFNSLEDELVIPVIDGRKLNYSAAFIKAVKCLNINQLKESLK